MTIIYCIIAYKLINFNNDYYVITNLIWLDNTTFEEVVKKSFTKLPYNVLLEDVKSYDYNHT